MSGWQVGRGAIGQVPVRLTGIDGGSLGDVPAQVGGRAQIFGGRRGLDRGWSEQLGVSAGDVVPVIAQSAASSR